MAGLAENSSQFRVIDSQTILREEGMGRSINRFQIGAIFAITLLGIGFLFLYSEYQTLLARVEGQDRRLERYNRFLADVVSSQSAAGRLEDIDQKVSKIEENIDELTSAIEME